MNKLRVLLAHNYYQQAGGEDIAFAAEAELLRTHGHEVIEYIESNNKINEIGHFRAASNALWSKSTHLKLQKFLAETKPHVAHFHNIFMLISPAAYYACKELGIPVVQTLHNYRLLCSNAIFFRNGMVCEKCLRLRAPMWGVVYKCYRGSYAQSAVVATMLGYHRSVGTWQNQVDCYVALTEFARKKFIQGGLPEDKILVKPNFVFDSPRSAPSTQGSYVLFVGRLSSEKGIDTLLRAWSHINVPLKIVGDGPLRNVVQEQVDESATSEYLGHLNHDKVLDLLSQARFTVFSSEVFENFPMTIVESFASGRPVIGPNLGACAELLHHEQTGLLYEPGDSSDLAAKVEWLWDHPEESQRMGRNARSEYEQKYTPENNYQILMSIYSQVVGNKNSS